MSSAGLEVPTFSMTPLSYISQIGEHLFTLPQQLEPYASVGAQPTDSRPASPFVSEDNDELGSEASELADGDSTGFVYQWVSAASRAAMSLYLQKISQIKGLSALGTKQLLTDIGTAMLPPSLCQPTHRRRILAGRDVSAWRGGERKPHYGQGISGNLRQ